MNPINQIIEALAGGVSRSGDWIWAIDPAAFQRHIVSRASARPVLHSSESYFKRSDTGATAIIPIHGVLMKDASYDDEVSTPLATQAVLAAGIDDTVESLLLDFDTPGGSCSGLAEFADAIDLVASQKPVVMQCSGMMCSAGYYLAAPGMKIYAQRMDLVGSIGTRMQLYDFSKMFANLGIEPVTIDTGPLKSTGVFGAPVTDEQKQYLQSICDSYQHDFAERVMRGRKFSQEQFAAVATGAVFPASEALRLKLIDGIQSLGTTLAAMPRRQQSTTSSQRSKVMSETTTPEAKPVTIADLKKEFPDAGSDFYMEQIEAEATLTQATKAYASQMREQLAAEKTAREAAEKDAAEAKAKADKSAQQSSGKLAQVRGNKPGAAAAAESAEAGPVDYYQMARDYQKERKCRWSEACLEIKRRHPESRAAFGAPPKT